MEKQVRKSQVNLNEVCFYTDTIKNWNNLLLDDNYKQIILNSLKFLYDKELIAIYGFVIMPNHIHLLWEMLNMNGKEIPNASFNKFTSHEFKKLLMAQNQNKINFFRVSEYDRSYRFWERDPLTVNITDNKIFEQKLDYIHLNPLQEKWNLANEPEEYKWSSAKFYETGIDDFGFLTHYNERL